MDTPEMNNYTEREAEIWFTGGRSSLQAAIQVLVDMSTKGDPEDMRWAPQAGLFLIELLEGMEHAEKASKALEGIEMQAMLARLASGNPAPDDMDTFAGIFDDPALGRGVVAEFIAAGAE